MEEEAVEVEFIEKPDGSAEVIISGSLLERLNKMAEDRSVTPQQIFEAALTNFLEEQGC